MTADHDLGGDVEIGYLVGLGNKRRRPGRTRVGFDDMDPSILDGELDVDQSLDVECPGDLFRVVLHRRDLQGGQVKSREHGMAVATVDACGLDMLHDAHHMEFLAVEYGVYFRLLAAVEEMVYEDLIAGKMLEQAYHRLFNLVVVDDDAHALTSEHIAGTDQHWIADPVRYLHRLIHVEGRSIIGVGDVQFLEHVAEPAAVFRDAHAVVGC